MIRVPTNREGVGASWVLGWCQGHRRFAWGPLVLGSQALCHPTVGRSVSVVALALSCLPSLGFCLPSSWLRLVLPAVPVGGWLLLGGLPVSCC